MAAERASKRPRLSSEHENSSIPGFARWDLEKAYEQKLRKKKPKDGNNRLPIKRDGRIEQVAATDPGSDDEQFSENESLSDADDKADSSAVARLHSEPAPQAEKIPHKQEVREAKEELARLAGSISESPDENIRLLKSLAELAASKNATVQRLALGTQLAVFKDIIPGYRIRALLNEGMQAKVSKDVRKLRDFEQSLLHGYREYVQMLAALAKDRQDSMAGVAITCACALLASVPHFNLRNEVIAILVQKLARRTVDEDFVKARAALEQLFRDDEEGHAALEAVGQLTKILKARNYLVHESVLNTFLHLRLLGEFTHKASTDSIDKNEPENGTSKIKQRQKKVFRTKRERKLLRDRKEVEKEMKEADAAVSYEDRDKNQSEMLKLVFVAYFRILKARIQHLMGAVLEGLAKYAHLINQDFFGDIIEALKDLINDAERSTEKYDEDVDEESEPEDADPRDIMRETLLCIITASALLHGQNDVAKSAKSLHLDLNFFVARLYRIVIPLCQEAGIELSAKTAHLEDPNGLEVPTAKDVKVNVATTTVLLLRSLEVVLLPKTAIKMVPPVRIAAFVKQLLAASLHLPPKSSEALIALLQQVSKVHGPRIAALWNTEERKGDGVFNALSLEAESSNPFASTVWEGELLRLHFDPKVRSGVKAVEKIIADVQ